MAAAYHDDIVDINLNSGTVLRTFMHHALCEGDIQSNRYGFRLYRDGVPVTIDGSTAMGYFIRHRTNETLVINGGTFADNLAYVVLPAACYAQEGGFSLVIKLVGNGITGTMRIIDGMIVNTTSETMIDPGSQVPDLAELMAVIGRAEAAAETIQGLQISREQLSGTRYKLVITKAAS